MSSLRIRQDSRRFVFSNNATVDANGNNIIQDISANDGTEYYLTFVDGSGNKSLYINSQGLYYKNNNIGINTSNPTQNLDVSGNIQLSGALYVNGFAGTQNLFLKSTGDGLMWDTVSGTASPFTSITDSSGFGNFFPVIVNSTGSVPSYITSTNYVYKNHKLGLNTSSPTQTLDISGNIKIDGQIYAQNSPGTNNQILTSTQTGVQWSSSLSGIDISASNVDISGYLNVDGPAHFDNLFVSNIDISGQANFTDISAQNVDISGYLNVEGLAHINNLSVSNIDVSGQANFTDISASNVDISGYLNVNGLAQFNNIFASNVDISGQANFNDISASNVDISGYLNVDGPAQFNNISASNIDLSGYLNVDGMTTLRDISANGDVDISGCLTVKCLTVTGPSSLYDVSVNNNIQFYGKVIADGSSGSINQVLTSTGTGVRWADPTGGSGGTASLVDISDIDISNNLYYYTFVDGSGQRQLNINSLAGLYYQNRFVGVNKINPSRTLDISGDLAISRGLYAQNTPGAINQILISTGSGIVWTSILNNVNISANYVDISDYLQVTGPSILGDISANGDVDISGCLTAKCLTISGPSNFLDISLGGRVYIGGTPGLNNQVLTSTSTGVIWSNAGGSSSLVNINDISANDGNLYYYTFVDNSGMQQMLISSGNGLFYKNTNIGINTDNPTQSLDISGNTRVFGTLDVSNVRIDGQLYANNSPGNNNQILTSTGSGITWRNSLDISSINVDSAFIKDLSTNNLDVSNNFNVYGNGFINDLSTNNLDVSNNFNVYGHGFINDLSTNNLDVSNNFNVYGHGFINDLSTNNLDVSNNFNVYGNGFINDLSTNNLDVSNNFNVYGNGFINDLSTNNLDVSNNFNVYGHGFINDLSTNNLDVSNNFNVYGHGFINDLSTNNLDVSNNFNVYGHGFINDLSTNNLDVSNCITAECLTIRGDGFINDLSANNLDVANNFNVGGLTILRDTSINGILSVSGTINGTVANALITDISANDGTTYYMTFVDGSGSKPLYINSFDTLAYKNQRVGIATNSPSNSLDVSGSATIRKDINFGNTNTIISNFDSNCYMNIMASSASPSVTDIFYRANPDASGVVFELSFNNWGSDNVNVVLDINLSGKSSTVSQGSPFILGKQYISNTSGGATFNNFAFSGFSRKDCNYSYSSPLNYVLKLLFQPTNPCSFITGSMRILNGCTESNISEIKLFLQ
jgi:hypothetical protein